MNFSKYYMLMVAAVAVSAFAMNYEIPQATVTPAIDGEVSAGEWADALVINIVYPDIINAPNNGTLLQTAPTSADDLSMVWRIKWDAENLFIACEVKDDVVFWDTNPADGFNAGDTAQIGINKLNDPANSALPIHDLVADTVNSTGAAFFNRGDSWASAVIGGSIVSGGYVIEVAVKWADYSYVPAAGDKHGVVIIYPDVETGGVVDGLITDSGSGNWGSIFAVPYNWNTMTLVDVNGCGANGRSEADFNADCYVDIQDFAIIAANWTQE